jgi:hypothetical protein
MKYRDTAGRLRLLGEIDEVPTGNLLWVDQVNGNDAFAEREQMNRPFKTLTAAKEAAETNDTIVVLPGTYDERALARDEVNWHFCTGATVACSSSVSGIFDTSVPASACSFKVTGHGEFKMLDGGAQPFLYSAYDNDDIEIECDRIEATNAVISARGTLLLRCNAMSSENGPCLTTIANALNATIYANDISSDGTHAVIMEYGMVKIFVNRIVSTDGSGISVLGGELHVSAYEIVSGSDFAVHHNSYEGNCWINGARLISEAGSAAYVEQNAGVGRLFLKDCTLISDGGDPSIAAANSGTEVVLNGFVVGNNNKASSVVFVPSTPSTPWAYDSAVK